MTAAPEQTSDRQQDGPISVFLVGQSACADPGLAAALAEEFELARCGGYDDLLQALARGAPDVIVMDDEAAVGPEAMLGRLARQFWRQYEFPYLPIVVLARAPDVDTVVRCAHAGARHVVSSQDAGRTLAPKLREAAAQRRLLEAVHQISAARKRLPAMGDMVGVSPPMLSVFSVIRNVAATDASVFITGESGTGKELVAGALHRFSHRRNGAFVCVNCAAIPKDLLESELFGHEKGSFTGAESQRIGSCERADGGTLFMDEIGDMDTRLQSKMLRFLQDFRFTRVGGSESLHTDTRVIAATNRNPKQQIQDGTLREDLYYRLNVVPVDLPPLRERKEDILVLANHFLQRLQDKYSKYFVSFSSEAVRLMLSYSWPGNVRELQNTIERIIVLSNSDRITAELFPEEIREAAAGSLLPELQVEEVQRLVEELRSEQPEPVDPPADGEDILPFEEVERRTILEALEKCGGDISKAARKLGLSRATIYRKLEKYGQK